MTTSLLLRVSSVVSLLFAAGHTLGGRRSWSPPAETDVLAAMRTFHFDAGGVSRTYLDFYRGFGFILSVFLVLQAVVLWQLASLSATERVQPIVVAFLVGSIVSAVLTSRFIFPVPVVFWAAIVVCLGLALFIGR